MAVSVFDLFKVGIGPSSSHTVGPMRAARLFTNALAEGGYLFRTRRVRAEMFGSLGATGKGHGTDTAVLLGLAGHEPDSVDVDQIATMVDDIRSNGALFLGGQHRIALDEKRDLLLYGLKTLPFHPNGMQFTSYGGDNEVLLERTYYSVGGGFVVSDVVALDGSKQKSVAWCCIFLILIPVTVRKTSCKALWVTHSPYSLLLMSKALP